MGDDRHLEAAGLDNLDEQEQTAALMSLRLALRWTMARDRWDNVERLVELMSAALAGGDVATFRRASGDMLAAGPKRVTGIGDTPTEPIPPKVRERLNELIHTLDRPSSDDKRPDGGRPPAPPRRR